MQGKQRHLQTGDVVHGHLELHRDGAHLAPVRGSGGLVERYLHADRHLGSSGGL